MVQRIGHGTTDPEMEVRLFLGALQARLAHQQSAPPTPERQKGQHLHWVLVVAEQRSDEGGCDPSRRGGSTLRSPQASVAQRRPHSAVNRASHTEVRVLPGALHVPVAQQDSARGRLKMYLIPIGIADSRCQLILDEKYAAFAV